MMDAVTVVELVVSWEAADPTCAMLTSEFAAVAVRVGEDTAVPLAALPLAKRRPPGVLLPEPVSAKKSRQIGSTLSGSARNCWYFSSTNQSFGPNSGTAGNDTVAVRLF
jgi:hypothetical protein